MEAIYIIVFFALAFLIGSSGLGGDSYPKPIIIQVNQDDERHRMLPSTMPVMIVLLIVLISIIVSS